jgi:hypothetical protein
MKYPTQHQFENSLLSADNADDNSRDTSLLMNFLTYFANNNPRIRGHINTRQTAIASWGWDIIGLDGKESTETEETSARLSNAIKLLTREICSVALFGNLCIKLDWKRQSDDINSAWIPVASKVKQNLIESMNDGLIALKDSRGFKTIIDSNNDAYLQSSDGSDFRGGIMRSIGFFEILRRDTVVEWMNYNKKLKGILQGIDKGADEQERSVGEEALKTATRENYIFTSDLIEFAFHNITAPQGSSFKDFLDHLNNSISIAILGQANTSELPTSGGSRAALQVQQMISADIMFSDIILLEQIVNEQLLKFDYMKNYQKPNPPYEFKISISEPVDYEQNVIIVREALNSGVPLIKSEVYEHLGFSVPQKSDELFQSAPQPPAVGFGG